MKHRCGIGQTLLDVAVVTTGSVETAVALAVANGIPVTARLENGQMLECLEPVRRDVVQRFAVSGMEPATELTPEDTQMLSPGGIGYMAVGVDFIVSQDKS